MSPSIFSILHSLIMESCDITEASLKLLRIIHSNNRYGDLLVIFMTLLANSVLSHLLTGRAMIMLKIYKFNNCGSLKSVFEFT
jgi:uncharacterized membrane protein YjjP (DUF1212 family)